jgi:hypothetical protein
MFLTIDSILEFCYVTKFLFFDEFTISMIFENKCSNWVQQDFFIDSLINHRFY